MSAPRSTVPSSTTLVLGGARSGKSRYAEELAVELGGDVLYVATAEPLDEEMRRRIAEHRARRPPSWSTLEAPRDAGKAIRSCPRRPDVVLVDCITLLVSNALLGAERAGVEPARAAGEELEALLESRAASDASWILVSNEVGMGLVPETPLGRLFRDVLGRMNQRLAAASDRVVFMVAGIPMRLR